MDNVENDKIIIDLYNKENQKIKYELLDIVLYHSKEYVVLKDLDLSNTEVDIFKVTHSEDKKYSYYSPEESKKTLLAVYKIFKEKYQTQYPNYFKFEDNF